MYGEWATVTLGEVAINLDTRRIPVKESDRISGPYPYHGASGVVDHVDGYLFDGSYLLVAEDGENLRTRQTPVAFMANGKFWVNMRHGGSLDWGTLQRQHALMLGGLCDSLVAFLFDVAWSRGAEKAEEPAQPGYDDFTAFNAYLDAEYEVEIAGSTFDASLVLFRLDETAYDAARIDWEAEQSQDQNADEEAAA
jgi:hypothetical protein